MAPHSALAFSFQDDLGPCKVIHVYEPKLGLRAALVVDNVAAGPAIGGLRMAEDVSIEECFRLARAMTLKNAAAGLPHGGGKSVLAANPKLPSPEKQALIRAFATALADEKDYIFGPDMGTDETCMAWVHDEIGRAVGLPSTRGGIPLDELGATGFGLLHAILAALPFAGISIENARVVVQGFGSVGIHAARFLAQKGAVLIGASDSGGAIVNENGLNLDDLIAHKTSGESVTRFAGGNQISAEELLALPCEIWIPAARPDVINEKNIDTMRSKIIAQGANIPATTEAERRLHEKGIINLPDFIANAGGVICAAMEYHGANQRAAFDAIAERISNNTAQMLHRAAEQQILPRQAAEEMAHERVHQAMQTRRWNIF